MKTNPLQEKQSKRNVGGKRAQLTIVARRRICDQFLEGSDKRQIARREGVTEERITKVIRTSFDVCLRTLSLVKVMVRDEAAIAALRREQAELERECWNEFEEAA